MDKSSERRTQEGPLSLSPSPAETKIRGETRCDTIGSRKAAKLAKNVSEFARPHGGCRSSRLCGFARDLFTPLELPMMKRVLCLVALASVMGCAPRLNVDKTLEVDTSSNPQTILEAIRTAQKIKVDVHATGGPIDIFVFLEKNKVAADKEINTKGGPSLIVDKRKIDSATFETTIPAMESAVIELRASTLKKATVNLKVTN
jgi:hypothetical protein